MKTVINLLTLQAKLINMMFTIGIECIHMFVTLHDCKCQPFVGQQFVGQIYNEKLMMMTIYCYPAALAECEICTDPWVIGYKLVALHSEPEKYFGRC